MIYLLWGCDIISVPFICLRLVSPHEVRYHFADISPVLQERISLKKQVLRLVFLWAARRGTRLSVRSAIRKFINSFTGQPGTASGRMPLARFHLLNRRGLRLNKFSSLGALPSYADASDGRGAASLSEAACRSSLANARSSRLPSLRSGSGSLRSPYALAPLAPLTTYKPQTVFYK